MKRTLAIILAAIMLLSVVALSASAEANKGVDSVLKAAYGTPVIDGEIDAVWATAEAEKYDTYNYIAKKDDGVCVGQFRALWDENYIYLLFEINDTTMCTEAVEMKDTNWVGRDGVAMAFCPSNDRTESTADVNKVSAFWFIIRAHGTVANYSARESNVFITEKEGFDRNKANDFTLLPANERMYVAKETATGYRIEMKINLKASGVTGAADLKLEAGTKIGFDTWTNENNCTAEAPNGTRHAGHSWSINDIDNNYKKNVNKGTLLLLAKQAPAPETGDNFGLFAVIALVAVLGTAIVVKKVND